MHSNVKVKNTEVTHEGGKAHAMNDEQALRRSVMSCMLFDSEFYEDGEEIGDRIIRLASKVSPEKLANIAIEVREKGNLRHVPLLLLSCLSKIGKGNKLVADTIERVIQRADELTEILAIHAKVNKISPNNLKGKIPAQMKKGIARAFNKFSEYNLQKYNRDNAIKLRDAMFICHPKPKDADQEILWKKLIANELATPDTWETELSAGKDKKQTFERLIQENKLGYLALLRNLRNMFNSGCDEKLVSEAILARKNGADRVLPFRYIAAARAAPHYEPYLDQAMIASIKLLPVLSGRTLILVDVSGSMDFQLSAKSDMKRIDAAAGLAAIWPGEKVIYSFSTQVKHVPVRQGMGGIDAIINSQSHGGTYLAKAVDQVNNTVKYDRIVVITDEQSNDGIIDAMTFKAYLINVASNKNGVGYGKWIHIDGFSERVIQYIHELENQD